MHQLLAMVKQLGTPTFFSILSYADLRWNELISIIYELNGSDKADEDIGLMSHHERCDIMNKNPVLVARHFQYSVDIICERRCIMHSCIIHLERPRIVLFK